MLPSGNRYFKPNLLAIAPPYGNRAPAGSAYLLGYLKSQGVRDFDFLDLRLWSPLDFTPSYRTTGAFGESYVLDTPDLPLVLMIIRAFQSGGSLRVERDELFEQYCLERAISPHFMEDYLASLSRFYERSFAQIPDIEFIGFSTWTPNYLSTIMAAAHLKRRAKPPFIVAGGPQVTSSKISAELGLRSGLFDIVALGEGEQVLHEIYGQFRNGGVSLETPGTASMKDGAVYYAPDRKLIPLQTLPVPSFDEMPIQCYRNDGEVRALPFQLSRGCTDKCSFCSEWVFWKHFRSDVPDHAVEQVSEILGRYKANFIEFSDSLLNGHQNRLRGFADGVLQKGIEFGWTSFMRAQMDAETAKLLARSGCSGVFIGIESFSDEALAAMNKRRTEADNIQAVIAFVEAGIHVTAGFIPGFPGDSHQGFLHSVQVLRNLQDRYPGRIALHEEPFTVMANAPIAKSLESNGLQGHCWNGPYIDILPEYAEACSKVLCSVTGNSQGIDRMGRAKLVGAIKTDAPVKGTFDEGYDEAISPQVFEFEHIFGGWSLAAIKTASAHRYCLLVNEEERAKLEELQAEHFPLDRNFDKVQSTVAEIESRHLARFSTEAPRLVRCIYIKERNDDTVYTVSPFIIARQMDWRHKNQVLAMDTTTNRHYRRSAHEATLIAKLAEAPATYPELCAQLQTNRAALKRSLEVLSEDGVIAVCATSATAH